MPARMAKPEELPKNKFENRVGRESATGHFWLDVYYLVPVPPSPWSSGIIGLAGFFAPVFEE
jgi:hypothetical protein